VICEGLEFVGATLEDIGTPVPIIDVDIGAQSQPLAKPMRQRGHFQPAAHQDDLCGETGIKLGDRLSVIPNHVCVVSNLFDTGLTSNFLTHDMQARLFRLGVVSNAFSDAHLQLVAATTLSKRDVLVAISYVGRMPTLLQAVRVARERGATIIALTRSKTPLAALSDVLLAVDVQEDATMRVGTDAYVVQLLLIEMLMVLVGLKRDPETLMRLSEIHDVLQTHGSDSDNPSLMNWGWQEVPTD
jgi:hypothetical protein